MFFSSNTHECQWCQWRDRQDVDAERLRLNGDGQITLHIALTEGVCVCVCVGGRGGEGGGAWADLQTYNSSVHVQNEQL